MTAFRRPPRDTTSLELALALAGFACSTLYSDTDFGVSR